ncbi:MAG: nitroreductase family protein [Pseudobdellovibrio sp.]
MEKFIIFKEIVNGRRSIRKFTTDKIPTEIMEECLDLALLAPNSSNLQPWEFYWIQDESKKKQIARFCMNQSAARTASDLIVIVARPDHWKQGQKLNLDHIDSNDPKQKDFYNYYSKIVPMAYSTDPFGILKIIKTVVAFVIGLSKVSYRGPFGRSGNLLWATKTTALAAENLMLALHAAGYDSCPMEGFDQVRVKKLLKLPCDAYVVMIIGAGRKDVGGLYGPRTRGPKDMFVKKI